MNRDMPRKQSPIGHVQVIKHTIRTNKIEENQTTIEPHKIPHI